MYGRVRKARMGDDARSKMTPATQAPFLRRERLINGNFANALKL